MAVEPTGFEPGPVGGPQPLSFDYHARPPNDPLAILDGEPLARLTALRQRRLDLFAQVPNSQDLREVQNTVTSHRNRIAALMRVRGEGGPGLTESSPQVRAVRRELERAETELARLNTLRETRNARAQACGQLERAVTDWLVNGGVPGNCEIVSIEDPPLSELLIKADGGRLDVAVQRYRQQVETHAEALRKLRASPFTAEEARAAIATEINARADKATPNVARVMKFLEPIHFATTFSQGLAQNVDPKLTPAIVANEAIDSLGVLCWMFRSEMIAKLQGMVTESADAVSQKDREIEEARLGALLLEVERCECGAIWHAEAKGELIDFRGTVSPQAVLGVTLVTRPPTPRGTSPQHVIEYGGGRR